MAADPEVKSGKGRRTFWAVIVVARNHLNCLLSRVYCRSFPISQDRDILKEEDLYTPIENCLYDPVNLAAEVLELKAKYSFPSGKLQHGHHILI